MFGVAIKDVIGKNQYKNTLRSKMKLIDFLKREKKNGCPIIDKKDVDKRLKELEDIEEY